MVRFKVLEGLYGFMEGFFTLGIFILVGNFSSGVSLPIGAFSFLDLRFFFHCWASPL